MDKKKLIIAIVIVVAIIAIAIAISVVNKDTKDTKSVYTISFNTDGGNKVASQKVEEGEKITKPADPSKEGYEFLGWYLNGKYFDFKTEVESNLTLEAKWKEIVKEDDNTEIKDDEKEDKQDEEVKEDKVKKYTVTFNSDGGTAVAKQTVEEGKKAKEPKAPTKDGYTFKGWYLGNTKYNFSNKVTKNITLKAKWEKVEEEKPVEPDTPVTPEVKEYTVTFNTDGGSSVKAQTVKENETASKPSDPTKEGYTFKGWYLDGAEYNFSSKITKNITLTAKWEKKDVITYKIEDTNSVLNQQKLYILKNGEAVAGTVNIVNTSGKTVTRSVPASGTTIIKGTYTKITNIKVN